MTWDRPKDDCFQARARLVDGFTLGMSCINVHAGPQLVQWPTKHRCLDTYNMISSTALPKETLSKAPKVSPSLLATLSVA